MLLSPYRRLSSKRPDPLTGTAPIVSAVKLCPQLEEAELRSQFLLQRADFRPASASQLLGLLVWTEDRAARGTAQGYELFGGFRHGGVQGISRAARRMPSLTSYINAYLLHHAAHPKGKAPPTWTSVVVYVNPEIKPHVDHRNQPGTCNYAVVVPGQMCLWTQERLGPQSVPAGTLSPEGDVGFLTTLSRRTQSFVPQERHSLVRTPEYVLAAFTPLGIRLTREEKDQMCELGFPMPPSIEGEARPGILRSPSVQSVVTEDTDLEADVQPDTAASLGPVYVLDQDLQSRVHRLGLADHMPRFREEGLLELGDLEFLYREDFLDMGLSMAEATALLEGFPGQLRVRPDLPQRASQLPLRPSPQEEREETPTPCDTTPPSDVPGLSDSTSRPCISKIEEVPLSPPEEVFRGHFDFWCINEEEWTTLVTLSSVSLRQDLWRALSRCNPSYYGGRVLDTNAQVLYAPGVTDERLIAAGVTNAVLMTQLRVLDLLLKGRLMPGSEGQHYQRYLLGQVLAVHAYPLGLLDFRIAARVRRTQDDVDASGAYIGDLFLMIHVNVQPSTVEVCLHDTLVMNDRLTNEETRVRAEFVGRDTDCTFDEMETLLFPVPAMVVDTDSHESSDFTGGVLTSSDDDEEWGQACRRPRIPSICKIVGPHPQGRPSEDPPPDRNLRMDVRFTRISPQTWERICTLEEREFERAMERISQEMRRDDAHSRTGTMSDHIPQGLLVSTVVHRCDWRANPTLTATGDDGVEIPLADVLHFSGDDPSPDEIVRERFFTFTIWDRIRDVVEVVLIVARLVEDEAPAATPEAAGSHDHVPRPPGPDPPAIHAVQVPTQTTARAGAFAENPARRRPLTVVPASSEHPAVLPDRSEFRYASAGLSEEVVSSSAECPSRIRAVSESLYTENLEAILEELDREGRKLETTHTAKPAEVKQHLDRWVEAMRSELDGHLEIGSLTKHVGEEAQALLSRPGAEVLPSLAVYTAKPPKVGSSKAYRRKCRAVACGNWTGVTSEEDTYSAGAQAEAVRIGLAVASAESWSAYVTDISQAFLRAPLPDLERLILLRPPAHFILAGISQQSEVWRARRAVYGLRESPKWWSTYRDTILRGASWTCNGEEMHLEQLEGSVWLLKDSSGVRRGVIVVYVDDCLVLSSGDQARAFHAYLNEVWETSPLESCHQPGEVVQFLGMTICKTPRGFSLGQQPYLEDLMKKYEVEATSRQTIPRDWVKEEPEQQEYTSDELRRAQSICGELLWLSQRTRPDLAHTTSLLASWTTRDPVFVSKLGLKVMQYLKGSMDQRLVLEHDPEAPLLECFTDASFAPYGSKSYTGIAIRHSGCLVLWRAAKQNLVTLSSSESELVAATEGVVLTTGVREILQQVSGQKLTIHLLVDNTAALQLLQGRGANRTRHLRIRSSFVKEKVDQSEVVLRHVPGEHQQADLFTKILPGPRLQYLRSMVGMNSEDSGQDPVEPVDEEPQLASVQTTVTCPEALKSWIAMLISCIQVYSVGGQEDEELGRLEVDPPYELMLLTVLLVLSVLAVWEGGRSILGCCTSRNPPKIRAVSKVRKGKSVEERVQNAIKKELVEEGLRQRRSADTAASSVTGPRARAADALSSTSVPVPVAPAPPPTSSLPVPPPPVALHSARATSASQTESSRRISVSQGTQTEVPYPSHVAVGIPTHQVCTTMQRGGVVHLYDDCRTLGVPAYRQSRAFCQKCLQRGGYL